MVAEQLLRPVPGGVGRRASLASHLPVEAAVDRGAVEFLVARHPPDRLAAVGLPAATRRLAWPGRLVTWTWVTLRRPALPGELLDRLDLVHATSAAVPPTGTPAAGRDRPRPRLPALPDAYPAAGRHLPDGRPDRGRRGGQVLVPSEATARDLAELYGVDRGQVTITPLGVEVPPSRTGPRLSGSCATWASAGRSCWPSAPWSRAEICPGCWTPSARWPAAT